MDLNNGNVLHGCGLMSCPNSGTKRCAKCKVIYYCSVACQTKDWSVHKKGCYKDRDLDMKQEKEKRNLLPAPADYERILSGMANNQRLVYDLIEYCLPKILTAWSKQSPDSIGAIQLIFSSVEDIQRIIQEYKTKTLQEIRFSVHIGFGTLASLQNNPLLGSDTVHTALLKKRYFATFNVKIKNKTLSFTITEFSVRDNNLVRIGDKK